MRNIHFADLLSNREHSRDFRQARSSYINVRIRLLALIFACLIPFWLPVDYLTLDTEHFLNMAALRVALVMAMLLTALGWGHMDRVSSAQLRVGLFSLSLAVFFPFSEGILGHARHSEWHEGYRFLPYVSVALLAVVPLTVRESLVFIGVILCGFLVGTVYVVGSGFAGLLNAGWLLALLVVVTLWVQLAQLQMLLMLYREATRDSLTGLFNRRALGKYLSEQMEEAEAKSEPLSVLLVDLDRFKRINDSYGHQIGDHVLVNFANVAEKMLGDPALVGRFGGEEFFGVLPGKDLTAAREMGEAIREACHDLSVPVEEGDLKFTVSIGVAQWRPGEPFDDLFVRVDSALYNAKESGRDIVVLAE